MYGISLERLDYFSSSPTLGWGSRKKTLTSWSSKTLLHSKRVRNLRLIHSFHAVRCRTHDVLPSGKEHEQYTFGFRKHADKRKGFRMERLWLTELLYIPGHDGYTTPDKLRAKASDECKQWKARKDGKSGWSGSNKADIRLARTMMRRAEMRLEQQ